MIDISVNSLVKSFEIGNNVLDGLTFSVFSGERVGILGHNGCGKTTLFRILVNELFPDDGEVMVNPSKRIGLISQIPVYPDGWTTEDVLASAQKRLTDLSSRLDAITKRMETDSSLQLINEYDRLHEEFIRLGGYQMEVERNRISNGLDISSAMRGQSFESLSGGEKTRVNLARLILENTEILLLDEPTNHLDLHATEWLEDYLLHFKGTVLAISHDRYFLDRTVNRCIEICEGKAELYSGNYSFYAEERQKRFEEKLKKYERDQAKIEQLTRAAEQMHLWAFMGNDKLHKRAFSMEKRIEKLSVSEKPKTEKKLNIKFSQYDFNGDEVLVIQSLSKAYGERTLFSNLDLKVSKGERIGIIGDNGSGKTTLMKLINCECSPDTGYLYLGPSVRKAYLPQIVTFEQDARSAYDTMIYECKVQPQEARDRLAAFGFQGEDVFVPVGALSGGERSRLKLCMLMGNEINLLMLDEPTNHLDIASREWIEDAVSTYGEALLFVSHDRYFIEKFATRIWAFDNGTVTDYRGSYSEYITWKERQEVYALNEVHSKAQSQTKSEKKQPVRGKEKAIAKIEKEIERIETQLTSLDAEAEEHSSDYQKLMEIDVKKAELQEHLDSLYDKWESMNQ